MVTPRTPSISNQIHHIHTCLEKWWYFLMEAILNMVISTASAPKDSYICLGVSPAHQQWKVTIPKLFEIILWEKQLYHFTLPPSFRVAHKRRQQLSGSPYCVNTLMYFWNFSLQNLHQRIAKQHSLVEWPPSASILPLDRVGKHF